MLTARNYAISLVILTVVSAISEEPLLLVISFDGFRADYLNLKNLNLKNFEEFRRNGVHATDGMIPCFTSKTFPNHFSIATGLYEESHGIIDNVMFNPNKVPAVFTQSEVSPEWWDNGISMPIWMLNQKAGRSSAVIMWPGGMSTYRNISNQYNVAFNQSTHWKDKMNTAFEFLTADFNPANCVFLYFLQPDYSAHLYGPFANETLSQVKMIDGIVEYLQDKIESLELKKKLNVILLSDHGMETIPKENQIQLEDIAPRNMCRTFGHGPVVNVFPNNGMFDESLDHLINISRMKNFKVYKKEELPIQYHYKNSANVGPIVLVADVPYSFIDFKDDAINENRGNHGYNNSLISMRALFMAKGPAFKNNLAIGPFQNVDLYQLMCHILDLEPGPNNGSTKLLSQIMLNKKSGFKIRSIDSYGLLISLTLLTIMLGIGILSLIIIVKKNRRNYALIKTSIEDEDEF